MEIIELLTHIEKNKYLNKLNECEWIYAKFLSKLISDNKIEEMFSKNPKVYLLIDNDEIISFCTYVHQDEIDEPNMYPWIGFVYTYPKYRGNHYFGLLLNHIISIAKKENHKMIYVSTNEVGLYEKYGFKYYKNMNDITGNDSRIYYIEI